MKELLKENRFYIVGFFVIFLIYLFRFCNLTILPVFADEAIYIRWAQVMRSEETLRFLPLSDGKQPLFMWLVIPFLKFIEDPLFAGRMVSVMAGLGTLIGISFLSFLLFKSKKSALFAGLIYVLSPFSFFFDRMALVDSLLSFFGVWTFIFSYLSITQKRLDYALLAGFALGGAWLTKSPALFFALMLPSLLVFNDWQKKVKENMLGFLSAFYYLLITVAIGYGFYNILRLGPNYSMIESRNLDYVYPISHLLSSPLDPLKPWLLQSWQWLVMLGPWPLIILGLLSFFVNYKKYPKELLILSLWFLGPIFIEAEFAKVLTARYIFFTIPYFIILASSVFSSKASKFATVCIILFIAKSLVFDFYLLTKPAHAMLPVSERSGYLEEWTAGQGIKETAEYLIRMQNSYPNEKIVVGTEGYFGTLPDGLQIYLNKYPKITVIGVGLNFSDIPQPLIESSLAGNKTYLLINNDRFRGDSESLGLKTISQYPKAQRIDGSHQSLMFFEITKPIQ